MSARLSEALIKSVLPLPSPEAFDCSVCGLLEPGDVVQAFDDTKPELVGAACVWCAGEVVESGIF